MCAHNRKQMTEAQIVAVGLRGGREPLESRNKTKYQCEEAGEMFWEFSCMFFHLKRQMLHLFPRLRLLPFSKTPTTTDCGSSPVMQNQLDWLPISELSCQKVCYYWGIHMYVMSQGALISLPGIFCLRNFFWFSCFIFQMCGRSNMLSVFTSSPKRNP